MFESPPSPASAGVLPHASAAEPSTDPLRGAPIAAWVDELLARAVRERASDLHLEPFEHGFEVRARIDGRLARIASAPAALAAAAISRVKVLAGLDIAETRVPQDGRIRITLEGRVADLRVSTLPVQGGESVVLRVLEAPVSGRGFDQLGLLAGIRQSLTQALDRPYGLIAVTGPTGSGKTTTLYAALERLHTADRKILTVEDPVEYEVDGVIQVPALPSAGRTFGTVLRAFLRHDPDVIMVGEIRDAETARVAVQAALTGHLVLATLHTQDTAGVVSRLGDMGIEPYLIAAALQGVLAQRLLPRLCHHCRVPCTPDPDVASRLGLAPDTTCFHAPGCEACEGRGVAGRAGLFEWLSIDGNLRREIAAGCSAEDVRRTRMRKGARSLRDEARALVESGEISPVTALDLI